MFTFRLTKEEDYRFPHSVGRTLDIAEKISDKDSLTKTEKYREVRRLLSSSRVKKEKRVQEKRRVHNSFSVVNLNGDAQKQN